MGLLDEMIKLTIEDAFIDQGTESKMLIEIGKITEAGYIVSKNQAKELLDDVQRFKGVLEEMQHSINDETFSRFCKGILNSLNTSESYIKDVIPVLNRNE